VEIEGARILLKNMLMNALMIGIVHPSFESTKRKASFYHLLAAVIILSIAIQQVLRPGFFHLYFWCPLLIGLDIVVVVFMNRRMLEETPRTHEIFRLVECLLILGAGAIWFNQGNIPGAIFLLLVGLAFGWLLLCEHSTLSGESVKLNHIGITISGIPQSAFFRWTEINELEIRYDSIDIKTAAGKTFHFAHRRNLQFEELDQIHEFCRHYLKTAC